ncbi:aldo/keto reductase [Caulobacter hibisci]|uniref:Aldo/keto reductase n=1 Tax=Caulobacter hibisci TaxID=2035993 RepID=A0ABS0T3S9_9CAUL|nr:aldo/keto reductase [Caulobacter hibisci]MBI1685740.1 aldo/keto reductase [Caulobacter hibisci]
MRYRPFGKAGMAVSAVTLRLADHPRMSAKDWRALIFTALEAGINSFEVQGSSKALLEGLGEGLGSVERRLLFVSWRLRSGGELLSAQAIHDLMDVIERCGLAYADLITIDDPGSAFPPSALAALMGLRQSRLIRNLGLASRGESQDRHLASGAFDALAAPFNLSSGWADRNRIRGAVQRDVAVIGEDFWPQSIRDREARPIFKKPSLWRRRTDPLANLGGYDFLDSTPGWSGQELCLGYALTEPSLATVQVITTKREKLEALAAVAERDLPTGCAAQIEMARFSAEQADGAKRRA